MEGSQCSLPGENPSAAAAEGQAGSSAAVLPHPMTAGQQTAMPDQAMPTDEQPSFQDALGMTMDELMDGLEIPVSLAAQILGCETVGNSWRTSPQIPCRPRETQKKQNMPVANSAGASSLGGKLPPGELQEEQGTTQEEVLQPGALVEIQENLSGQAVSLSAFAAGREGMLPPERSLGGHSSWKQGWNGALVASVGNARQVLGHQAGQEKEEAIGLRAGKLPSSGTKAAATGCVAPLHSVLPMPPGAKPRPRDNALCDTVVQGTIQGSQTNLRSRAAALGYGPMPSIALMAHLLGSPTPALLSPQGLPESRVITGSLPSPVPLGAPWTAGHLKPHNLDTAWTVAGKAQALCLVPQGASEGTLLVHSGATNELVPKATIPNQPLSQNQMEAILSTTSASVRKALASQVLEDREGARKAAMLSQSVAQDLTVSETLLQSCSLRAHQLPEEEEKGLGFLGPQQGSSGPANVGLGSVASSISSLLLSPVDSQKLVPTAQPISQLWHTEQLKLQQMQQPRSLGSQQARLSTTSAILAGIGPGQLERGQKSQPVDLTARDAIAALHGGDHRILHRKALSLEMVGSIPVNFASSSERQTKPSQVWGQQNCLLGTSGVPEFIAASMGASPLDPGTSTERNAAARPFTIHGPSQALAADERLQVHERCKRLRADILLQHGFMPPAPPDPAFPSHEWSPSSCSHAEEPLSTGAPSSRESPRQPTTDHPGQSLGRPMLGTGMAVGHRPLGLTAGDVLHARQIQKRHLRQHQKQPRTTPHLVARTRRKRIAQYVRALQDLLPGGPRSDMATVLEDSVTFLKGLVRQVQELGGDPNDPAWMLEEDEKQEQDNGNTEGEDDGELGDDFLEYCHKVT